MKTIFLDCEHHRRHLYICSRFVFVNSIFRRCLVYYNSRNVKQYSCTEFLLEDDFENCYEYNVYYLLSVNLVPPSLSLSLFFFDFLLTSRGESYSFFSKKERRELSPSTSLCRRTKVPESQRTKSVSRSLWDAEERFAGMGSKKPIIIHSFCIGRVTRCNLVCNDFPLSSTIIEILYDAGHWERPPY